ncbi:MAG TPA: hypothetical protein VMY15_01020 [Candidatus Latescibacteria bacterium]|nr:hypothetical protein [Candidatus Latescibacterota bacterium]
MVEHSFQPISGFEISPARPSPAPQAGEDNSLPEEFIEIPQVPAHFRPKKTDVFTGRRQNTRAVAQGGDPDGLVSPEERIGAEDGANQNGACDRDDPHPRRHRGVLPGIEGTADDPAPEIGRDPSGNEPLQGCFDIVAVFFRHFPPSVA